MTTPSSNKPGSFFRPTTDSYYAHSNTVPDAQTLQREVAKDMCGMSIGPMPVQSFLDRYLPKKHPHKRRFAKGTFRDVQPGSSANSKAGLGEKAMYKPLVDIMNKKNICPGFVFYCTADKRDEAVIKMSPDIGVYAKADVADKDLGSVFFDWTRMQMVFEIKSERLSDPYRQEFTKDEILDNSSNKSIKSLGQLFTYAALLMSHQFRRFVFAVGIYESEARFCRFDPSSVAVSASFDYHEHPKLLAEFFLRYAALNPAERGFDTTALPATKSEKTLFHSHIRDYLERVKNENLRQHPHIEDIGKAHFPVSKVRVDGVDGSLHWYLVCKPKAAPANYVPCGSFARGFIAVPVTPSSDHNSSDLVALPQQKGKLYWLKDYWRLANRESESDMYHRLKEKDVPNLPEVICGGDVCLDGGVQQTENDLLLTDPGAFWRRPTALIRRLTHHRIVQELLIPLERIENARELLRAGRDVMETIAGAFHEAKVFHCNVSYISVMLTEKRSDGHDQTAVLSDWDRAKKIDSVSTEYNPRTVNWQFVSVDLLRDGAKPYEVFDDLESLMWVLLYTATRRFKRTGDVSANIFDQIDEISGARGRQKIGGDLKRIWLRGFAAFGFECPLLNDFFDSLRAFHAEHFTKTEDAQKAGAKNARDSLSTYKADIEKDLRQLLPHFDSILEDPAADWSNCATSIDKHQPTTANQKQKKIYHAHVEHIREGSWTGGGRDYRTRSSKLSGSRPRARKLNSKPGQSILGQVDQARGKRRARESLGSGKRNNRRPKPVAVTEDKDEVTRSSSRTETTSTTRVLRPRKK